LVQAPLLATVAITCDGSLLWNRPKRSSGGRKPQTMALIEDYGFTMLPGTAKKQKTKK
jgi:hypothetical protein